MAKIFEIFKSYMKTLISAIKQYPIFAILWYLFMIVVFWLVPIRLLIVKFEYGTPRAICAVALWHTIVFVLSCILGYVIARIKYPDGEE